MRHARWALALTLFGCASPVDDAATSTTPGALAQATTPPRAPAGLMMRQGAPPGPPEETYVTSSVAMISWSDVQPNGPSDHVWDTLDAQLSALASAGVTHIRLRIMAGGDAPAWVKRLGGPPSGFTNGVMTAIDCSPKGQGARWGGVATQNVQGPTACVPFFWTPAYLDAYRNLMALLDAQLRSSPRYDVVDTVVDSACMTVYAEPFYRGGSLGPANETLYDAGLTHQADIGCHETAIDIHRSVFGASRRTSLAINDWDIVQGTPGPSGDYRSKVWYDGGATFATYELVEWARQQLTIGGVEMLEVQNNGLHSTGASCPAGGDGTTSYWCYIAQFAGRHGFQTQSYQATPRSPSGASLTLLEDLDNGLALHAQYVELPAGMTTADWKLMGCYQQHLLAGDASPCPH